MRITRVTLLTFVFMGALSACGGGVPSAKHDGIAVAPQKPSPSASPNKSTLSAALLTASDLPAGWKKVPNAAGTGANSSCLDKLAAPGGPVDLRTSPTVTFAAGKIGPFIAAAVVMRPAKEVLTEINNILVSCDGTSNGEGFKTRIGPASLPGLPVGSIAVEGNDTNDKSSKIEYTIASAGTDRATSFVFAVTPLGKIDNTVVASAVTAMYGRLPVS